MNQDEPTLDHDTLAAYISNTLSADERAAVTQVLVRDPEARQLLAMAARAIGAERDRHRGQLGIDSRDRGVERSDWQRSRGSDRSREKSSR